jgi:hypothetical protein
MSEMSVTSVSEPPNRTSLTELGPDLELWWLANLANPGGLGIKVILVLGGSTITGVLISDGEFFRLLAEEFDTAMSKKAGRGRLAEICRVKAAERARLDSSAGRPGTIPDIWHIHLKDARIWAVHGGARALGLWRGKLSQVSGWSLEPFG